MPEDHVNTVFQEGGIVLADKPKGWTSFDVVAKIRGDIKKRSGLKKPKVGHTGTLDPLATGLMIVVVGKFCKRAEEFSKLDKVYDVELTLGATSTTGDSEGEITPYNKEYRSQISDTRIKTQTGTIEESNEEDSEIRELDSEFVKETILSFVGEIEQVPPVYSAIKINGQRAYDLARAGKAPEMKPRKVTIYSISDIKYDYPKVWFSAKVSSGTYIRSLAVDIGVKLNTGAYMSNLRRTEVGQYTLAQAKSVEEIIGSEPKFIKELAC